MADDDDMDDSFEAFLSTDLREIVRAEIREDVIVKNTSKSTKTVSSKIHSKSNKNSTIEVKLEVTELTQAEKILLELQQSEEKDCNLEYDLEYEKCPVCCLEKIRRKPIKVQHIKACAAKNYFSPAYVIELMKMCRTTRVPRKSTNNNGKERSPRKPRKPKNELFEIELYSEEYKSNRLKERVDKLLGRVKDKGTDNEEDNDSGDESSAQKVNVAMNPMPLSWKIASSQNDYEDYILPGFEMYFVSP